MNFGKNAYIHIPQAYWSTSNFRATLGHKVNHSFMFAKSKFSSVYHPRFGNIKSVVATSNITKGEEIFVNYGYSKISAVPEWYSNLYLEETGKHWSDTTTTSSCKSINSETSSKSCGCGK